MQVVGTLKVKFDTQRVSDRFQQREIIITIEEDTPYPQHVSFKLTQDNCQSVNDIIVGSRVRAMFNLKGREWNGPQGIKYFNTLEIWKIEKVD